MAHRYFKTKREAERAARKLRRASYNAHLQKSQKGWIVVDHFFSGLTQEEFDDVLSNPLPRRKNHARNQH